MLPEKYADNMSALDLIIKDAKKNNLVVGSQARILYADCEGRIKIAKAINQAIKTGTFYENEILIAACERAVKNNKRNRRGQLEFAHAKNFLK